MDDDLAGVRFDIDDDAEAERIPYQGRSRGRPGGSKANAVCIHYLVGMCALDKECPYLHQYDYDKIPTCPYGAKCVRGDDCPFKHVSEEDKVECVFFRQGFCMYGPNCRYRHIHRTAEECPEEANFDMSQWETHRSQRPPRHQPPYPPPPMQQQPHHPLPPRRRPGPPSYRNT